MLSNKTCGVKTVESYTFASLFRYNNSQRLQFFRLLKAGGSKKSQVYRLSNNSENTVLQAAQLGFLSLPPSLQT